MIWGKVIALKGLNDIVDILVKLVEIGIKCMIWFTTSHNVLLLHTGGNKQVFKGYFCNCFSENEAKKYDVWR